MDDAEQKRERDMQAVRKELERKSHDTWRIYNPLDIDFVYYFDGYPNKVKAKSTKDVEFFRVRYFFKAISEAIIGELQQLKGQEIIKKHESLGQGSYLDAYTENINVWNKVPRLDDAELLKQIADQVVIGLVEEYGYDIPERSSAHLGSKPVDTRTIHDQVLGILSKKLAPTINSLKEELREEGGQANGDSTKSE